jgi:ketosteroid isomerase-like protein
MPSAAPPIMLNPMNCTRFSLAAVMLALLLSTSAIAQDAAAPIRRTSPTPAEASPTPKPTASPSATPEQAPPAPSATPAAAAASESPSASAPAERAERAEAKSGPSSSRRVLDEPPVRAIQRRPAGARRPAEGDEAPSSAPVILPRTRPTFDLSPQGSTYASATIRALENRWQRAIAEHDVATIDELVADDFVAPSATGRLGSKSTLLNEARRDKNIYSSATTHGIIVRSHGPRVAVATGVSRESGTTADGRRFTNQRRFTDTWMQREGRWQCVASHATELPKK